ncbi:MAG: hypothetical protein H6Q91_2593, partial [Deltaproteobacteria bacterium]|nr:hypothetical protein [Deltaproteobacteria bacterium]
VAIVLGSFGWAGRQRMVSVSDTDGR